jgi:ribosomal protein L29
VKEIRSEDAEELARIVASLEPELARTRAANRWRYIKK